MDRRSVPTSSRSAWPRQGARPCRCTDSGRHGVPPAVGGWKVPGLRARACSPSEFQLRRANAPCIAHRHHHNGCAALQAERVRAYFQDPVGPTVPGSSSGRIIDLVHALGGSCIHPGVRRVSAWLRDRAAALLPPCAAHRLCRFNVPAPHGAGDHGADCCLRAGQVIGHALPGQSGTAAGHAPRLRIMPRLMTSTSIDTAMRPVCQTRCSSRCPPR